MLRLVPLALFALGGTAYAQEAVTQDAAAPAGRWDMAVAAGVSSESTVVPGMQLMGVAARSMSGTTTTEGDIEPTAMFSLRYRITERVVWSVPTLSFAYLGGKTGEREWIPWAGLTSWGAGYSTIEHFISSGQVGAGVGVREWLGASTALNLTAGADSGFYYRSAHVCDIAQMCLPSWQGPTTWTASATAGITQRFGALTLNLGGRVARPLESGAGTSIGFGSVQDLALRRQPLVQAQLSPRWSLDGYAAASYDLAREKLEQWYLVGFTRTWPH